MRGQDLWFSEAFKTQDRWAFEVPCGETLAVTQRTLQSATFSHTQGAPNGPVELGFSRDAGTQGSGQGPGKG